jgi:hypothetical protein
MFLGYKPDELDSTVEYRVLLMPLKARTTTLKTYLPYEIQYPEYSENRYVKKRQLQYTYVDIEVLHRPAIVLPAVESTVGYGFMETTTAFSDYNNSPAFFTIDSRRFWWPKTSGWSISSYEKYALYGSCITYTGCGAFPMPETLKRIQQEYELEAPVKKSNRRGIMDWDDSILKDDNRSDFEYLLRGI